MKISMDKGNKYACGTSDSNNSSCLVPTVGRLVGDTQHNFDKNAPTSIGTCTKPSASALKSYLLTLHSTHILPDIESSSPSVARSLLPTMRKLKWSLQRDRLAREFKNSGRAVGLRKWLEEGEEKGIRRRVFVEGETVRLAVCPDVTKRVWFFERLGKKD